MVELILSDRRLFAYLSLMPERNPAVALALVRSLALMIPHSLGFCLKALSCTYV